jgi:hypothetical protein
MKGCRKVLILLQHFGRRVGDPPVGGSGHYRGEVGNRVNLRRAGQVPGGVGRKGKMRRMLTRQHSRN